MSFPRPVAIEGLAKFERVFALGLEYSALPQITVSDVRAQCWAVAGSARVFPFRGPFFMALRAGRQHLTAETTVSQSGYAVPIALGVDTTFLNPQLGFLWTWEPGISIGIDAGLQIPISSSTSSDLKASIPGAVQPFVAPARARAENVARAIGQTLLPTLDLIKIGVLF